MGRIFGNMTDGDGDANLTLTGEGGGRLIDVTSTGSLTITGPNIDPLGDGAGRLNLKLINSGSWNVANAAAKLILNADVDENAGSVSLAKTGTGELDVRRALNVSGTMMVAGGTMRLRGASGRMLFSEAIHLSPGAGSSRLLLDNSTVVRNDRIGDQAKLVMSSGSIFEATTGSGLVTSERGGFVSLTRVGGDFSRLTRVGGDLAALTHVGGDFVMRLSGGGITSLTWIGLDRSTGARGVLYMERPVGSNFIFQTSPGLPNDIIGDWAVINGDNWATLDAGGTVVPFTNYETGTSLVWSPRSNVFLYGEH